jgi:hypothetical protein
MTSFLACTFPVIVAAVVLVFLPVRIPVDSGRLGDPPRSVPDTAPLPYRQQIMYNLPGLLSAIVLTCPIVVAQKALFAWARDSSAAFSQHAADLAPYAFIPSMFLAIVASFPVGLRVLRYFLGERLLDLQDRPDRSGRRFTTIHWQVEMFSRAIWITAVVASALNFAAYDTFLTISNHQISCSAFFSPVTNRYPISSVTELVIYPQRLAPNGRIVNKPWLSIGLRGRAAIDTFYLIETNQIQHVIETIKAEPTFTGRVLGRSLTPPKGRDSLTHA